MPIIARIHTYVQTQALETPQGIEIASPLIACKNIVDYQ